MPGDTLTKRELRARLRTMQKQLRNVRTLRKKAQSEIFQLTQKQKGLTSPLASHRSTRSSSSAAGSLLESVATSRSNLSARGKARHHFESRRKRWGDFSVVSRREEIDKGRSSSRCSSAASTQRSSTSSSRFRRSRATSRGSLVDTKITKWNRTKNLWETYDTRLPRGSQLLNEKETLNSQIIDSLLMDPEMKTSSSETMLTMPQLMERGLISELSAKQREIFAVDPKLRCPRVLSPLTKFAEHAIKNKLKPFSLGRD